MLLGCSWGCCFIILFWALCAFIVPRPTPVSISQSRPLSSKPDSGTFWGFLFALQALNLLMDTDSWIFTHGIRTGRFSKGYLGVRGEVVTVSCSPVMGGGGLCGLDIPGTDSCPVAPFTSSQEGRFQHLSQTCCSSVLAEEGQQEVQPLSLQKCEPRKFLGSVSCIPIVECSREPDLHPQPAQLAAPADGLIDLLRVVTRWSSYNIEGGYAAILCPALPACLPLSPSLSITPVKITFQSFPTGKHHLQPVMHFVSLQKVIPIEVSTSVIYVIKI